MKKCRHADLGKAKRELGYRPTMIRDAVHEAYDFHYRRDAIVNPRAKRPRRDASNDHATPQAADPAPNHSMRIMTDGRLT
ncbi:MAG: hypothetical protein OXC54_08260 [Rhodospirillaceae bacterium]|nr:hypothetical protein [Rhodospirillaceae bacterium]